MDTCLSSKVVSQNCDTISPMAVDAVLGIIDPLTDTNVDLRDIKVCHLLVVPEPPTSDLVWYHLLMHHEIITFISCSVEYRAWFRECNGGGLEAKRGMSSGRRLCHVQVFIMSCVYGPGALVSYYWSHHPY